MTHHTAKANLEKGSFWPPEAIPCGVHLRVDFLHPEGQNPHLGPDPRCPWVLKPPCDPIINQGLFIAAILTCIVKACND